MTMQPDQIALAQIHLDHIEKLARVGAPIGDEIEKLRRILQPVAVRRAPQAETPEPARGPTSTRSGYRDLGMSRSQFSHALGTIQEIPSDPDQETPADPDQETPADQDGEDQ